MLTRADVIENLQKVSPDSFDRSAIDLFQYQYRNNMVYKAWVDHIGVDIDTVCVASNIPCLPIVAFRNHVVASSSEKSLLQFVSSGTSSAIPSIHHVYDVNLYLDNAVRIFEDFYGPASGYCFLALLPNYLERTGSSLVAMVDRLIALSEYEESGFYLYDHAKLRATLNSCKEAGVPTVLFGVSYALLDLVREDDLDFSDLIIVETGGMKGRRKEMTKDELQRVIAAGFNVANVHSEYGMTELFSQAYSVGSGLFQCGRSMQVFTAEVTDPMTDCGVGKTGVLRVIDLANIDSCAFVETQDLGRVYADGTFELYGRLDQADIRGCNLMVSDL